MAQKALRSARSKRITAARCCVLTLSLAIFLLCPAASRGETVSWAVDGDGFWDVGTNWSTGNVPQAGDDVVIDRPSANVTVTHRFGRTSGVTTINSLTGTDHLVLSGGALTLAAVSSLTTLELSGGTLNGPGNLAITGLLTWSGGTFAGSGATNANGGISLINSSSVSIRDTRVVNNMGTATWTGAGAINTDAGTALNNLPGATFAINTTGDYFSGTFNNMGTVTKTAGGGDTLTRFTTAFNNSGTVTVTSGILQLESGGAHSGSFSVADAGELAFDGGTHTMSPSMMMSGAGRVRLGTGTTNFSAGTYNITGTTECTGGTHTFQGPVNVLSIGNLEVSFGTLNFSSGESLTSPTFVMSSGILGGSDMLTVTGLFTWLGGTLGGTGTLNANGGIDLSNPFGIFLRNTRVLNNSATATWTGAGSFGNDTGATFNNLPGATFAIQTNGDFSGGLFNNSGTLTKAAGGGDGTTRILATFNNSGSVTVNSGILTLEDGGAHTGDFTAATGGTVDFAFGTHTLTGASLAGMGRTRISGGTVQLTAATTADVGLLEITFGTLTSSEPITATTYMQSGGTLGGSATLTVSGMLTWSAGAMTGTGVTNASGGMTLSNASTIFINETRVVNNAGVASWTGTGSFNNQTGAIFNNLAGATLAISSIGDFFDGTFNNAGTVTKTGGGGDMRSLFSATFNNSGMVNVNSGILELDSGGTHSGSFAVAPDSLLEFGGGTHAFGATASVSGGGRVRFGGGTANFNGGTYNVTGATECTFGTHTFSSAATVMAVGTLEFGNGTLNFNSGEAVTATAMTMSGGILGGSDSVTISGLLILSGGTMRGLGTTNANGGIDLINAGTVSLSDVRTLNNAGTATWTGVGGIGSDTGAIFNNLAGATLAINTTGDVIGGTFNNAGTLTKTAGGGDGITRFTGNFNNSGTVEALGGTLRFENSYVQTSGVTRLNGGTINSTTTTGLDIDGGLLTGFGTITGNVDNTGDTAPGLSPGLLQITGTYTQRQDGDFSVEIGGLTAGTQFDQLTITGNATLAGTLSVALVNNFTPTVGDVFRIMTFAAHSGDFVNVTGAVTSVGRGFHKNTQPTFVELVFVEEDCDDGQDNDADGATDCADAKCAGHPACLVSNTATPTSTRTPATPTPTSTRTVAATFTATATGVATSSPTNTALVTQTPSLSPTLGVATASPTPTRRAGFNVSRRPVALPAAPIVAANFGTDAAVDLAVGNSSEPSVALLRNTGQANFVIADEVTLTGGTGGIADVLAVDINDDGFQDVIASNPGAGLVAVAFGNGQHMLGDPQLVNVGGTPRRLAVGQLVGDDNLDVLVAMDNVVFILRGLGDGGLELVGGAPIGGRAVDLVITDVNADGDGDFIAAVATENFVQVHLGDGDGDFTAGTPLAVNHPVALVLAPFSGGTRGDLAVASDQNDWVAVFRATGTGFETTAVVTSNVIADRLLAAEMTGDSFLDLIAINTPTGTARVLAGLGDGRFGSPPGIDLTIEVGAPIGGGAVADLNNDGATDVVLTDPATEDLIVALNEAAEPAPCGGDCNDNGTVEINELALGVAIIVGDQEPESCLAFDSGGNLMVEVDELLIGISNGLNGCEP